MIQLALMDPEIKCLMSQFYEMQARLLDVVRKRVAKLEGGPKDAD